MAILDRDTTLTRTRLAADATAIGHAVLEGDLEEARFRAQLLRIQAEDLGLGEAANAALRVMLLLPVDHCRPERGIGLAVLRLCDSLGTRH